MNTCCLCSELVAPSPGAVWNTPLFESANFLAIPSLGSLVEGWQLLVPKKHFLNMAALPQTLAMEMDVVKGQIASGLMRQYGQICIFEHGPSRPNASVGCGVDHAHLHFVPLDLNLFEAAKPYLPAGTAWVPATLADCRVAHVRNQDYLYVEQPLGTGHMALSSAFGSQIFRKAIAAHIGRAEQFNWREHPCFENITRTIRSASLAR